MARLFVLCCCLLALWPAWAAPCARMLALDPERVTADELRELLGQGPAPRILLFQASLLADMESFGAFLQRMGYPERSLRHPVSGRYSYRFAWSGCDCEPCVHEARSIVQQWQHDGLAPMLVGHSGGGATVSRLLHLLAEPPAAWPGEVPRLPFAAMLGTGALLRRLPGFPGCAADIPRLALVPPSVQEFTGYRIAGDPFTSILGFGEFRAVPGPAAARVRNLQLSGEVGHLSAFEVDGYAEHAEVRAWIDAYRPGQAMALPSAPGLDLANLPHIADLWHAIKKHWLLQARHGACGARQRVKTLIPLAGASP